MARSTRVAGAIGAVTLAVCAVLVTDLVPWLRGDVPWIPDSGQWVWPYDTPRWVWLVPVLAGVALYLWGAGRLLHVPAGGTASPLRLLLWAYGGAVLLPLLLLTLEGPPLFLLVTRSISPITGGYPYAAAMVDDADSAFVDWPGFVATYREERNVHPPSGVALSPPGLVMAYRAVDDVLGRVPGAAENFGATVRPMQCQNLELMTWDNSEMAGVWLQILMPFWAGLAVVPLYRLGTLVFGAASARLGVLLWPLVPGLAVFQPRFNVLYALLAVVMLWWLWRGLLRERAGWIVASGVILSAGMFFNLALVPLGLLAGLTLVGYRVFVTRRDWRRLAVELVAFGAGSAAIWLAYWAASGLAPWDLLEFLLNQHYDLYRPYWPWLVLHPADMFLFVGMPVTLLALWRIARVRRTGSRAGDVFALALALTVLALVLSGTARGETGRVWLFFAPGWVLLAVDMLRRLDRRTWVAVLALQAVCLVSMAAVLRANFTTYTLPPNPPPTAQGPVFRTDARFSAGEDAVTLVGLSLDTAPDAVTLHLHWRAESRVERPYVLSLIGVAPDGVKLEPLSWNPYDWDYPPSCWAPGEEFVDTVRVPLDANAVAGDWLFSLSVQDVFTQQAMQVSSSQGAANEQFGIGPVTVPAAP